MTIETTPQEPSPVADGKVIATVKFRSAGKQYDFDTNGLDLQQGDTVVVETNRGRALGAIARPPRTVAKKELPQDLKKILRLATEADQTMARISASKEKEAYDHCFERIRQRKMPMKLVKAEYLFDGSKIIFYFTADGRVDFRELVKDLAHSFHTRIEMRQIGVRDEAKLIGGIGICGRELCCGTFLTDFHPVSVRMAKQQGLALNPTKISGQCGRLLCCLGYEYNTYCKMSKQLPKQGTKVTVDGQPAEVLSSQILSQTVTLRCNGKVIQHVPLSDLSRDKGPGKIHAKADDRGKAKASKTEEQSTDTRKAGKPAKKADGRGNRPPRNKGGESRPGRDGRNTKQGDERATKPGEGRTAKPGEGRPSRHKKPTPSGEGGKRSQRPPRPAKKGDGKPPQQTPTPTAKNAEDKARTENTTENKPNKRRSRSRRRPPRKS
ncbi:MAG: hypothetical protein J7K75_04425 [Desulfuromonas sp.]|nr:hypothetical protein [Desulfuromonas sp.]